jgi:hypothetical protein
MKITSFLLVFLLSFSALAKDVTTIKKGDKAPYDGQLFTHTKAESVRKELIEKDQLKIFNQALKDTIAIQDKIIVNKTEQVGLLTEQNEKLVKQVEEAGHMSGFEKAMWFGLGIAATSLAIYGASSLVRR